MIAPAAIGRIAVGAAAAVPFLITLAFTLAFSVDVPHVDEWNMVEGIGRILAGDVGVAEFAGLMLIPHNEHVATFPRAAILLNAWATGWNLRVQMVATTLAFLAALLALRRPIVQLGASWALPVASIFLFSLHGIENWLWGCQIHVGIAVLGAVCALVTLSRDRLDASGAALGAACALVASWSFLNGMLVWPVGLMLLLARRAPRGRGRLAAVAVWCAGAAVAAAPPLLAHARSFAPAKGSAAGDVAEFVARYLGAGLLGGGWDGQVLAAVGAAALVAFAAAAVSIVALRRDAPAALGILAIGVFGVASGVMIAIGRLPIGGLASAASSRFAAFSGLAWIAIAVLPRVAIGGGAVWARRGATAVAIGLCAVVLVTQLRRVEEGRATRDVREAERRAFRSGEGLSAKVLGGAFGAVDLALPSLGDRLATLRRHGLTCFKDAPPPATERSDRLEGTVHVAQGGDGVVEARGGVPGTIAFVAVSGSGIPSGPFHWDDRGRARHVVECGAETEGAQFVIFSLDRAGRIVRSGALPVAR